MHSGESVGAAPEPVPRRTDAAQERVAGPSRAKESEVKQAREAGEFLLRRGRWSAAMKRDKRDKVRVNSVCGRACREIHRGGETEREHAGFEKEAEVPALRDPDPAGRSSGRARGRAS